MAKAMPTDDPLLVEVIFTPTATKSHPRLKHGRIQSPYDYYKLVRTIPGEEALRPMEQGD